MEGLDFISLLSHILHGGVEAVITLLLATIAYLLIDRKNLTQALKDSHAETLQAKEGEKKVILEILDKYHLGTQTMVGALTDIKIVLATLQGKVQ